MSDVLKLKYKVGQIEFEAEGPADAVEQQRVNFMSAVLPAAVDAMERTQSVEKYNHQYIDTTQDAPLLENKTIKITKSDEYVDETFSRTNLASYIKKYGYLSDQDFVLFAAYFDEKKNGTVSFSSENVTQYYKDVRRPAYSNKSELLRQLAKKGYIMDAPTPEGAKSRNFFMLTDDGIQYIKSYVPKEEKGEKKKVHTKPKKSASNTSVYTKITADDLNLKNYPALKSLSGAKEQIILAMYIVTNEGEGEWFTVDDVIYLLVNIFELPANIDMVNGVFRRNKSMFLKEKDPSNKKALRRKLLSGAKDLAKELIQSKK